MMCYTGYFEIDFSVLTGVGKEIQQFLKIISELLNMPSTEVATSKVVVHPLVLLSVVDHFNRMDKIGNQRRVVGVLLGCWRAKGVLDVSNSFAGNWENYKILRREFLKAFLKGSYSYSLEYHGY